MCYICQLVSDDTDGGVFITSQPPCSKGRELAAAHHIRISRLPLYAEELETQSLVSLDADEEASSAKY